MTAVERAAEVLATELDWLTAEALVAAARATDLAGLLVTDEIQAVLDIAECWYAYAVDVDDENDQCCYDLHDAIGDYLASRGRAT